MTNPAQEITIANHRYRSHVSIGGDTYRRERQKIGRNEPCPCNSGKKYKKCHGGLTND